MKRTILAAAIALTSFGAMADMGVTPPPVGELPQPPAEGIEPIKAKPQTGEDIMLAFNKYASEHGAEIFVDDNGNIKLSANGKEVWLAGYDSVTGEYTLNETNAPKLRETVKQASQAKSEHRQDVRRDELRDLIAENDAERIKQYMRDTGAVRLTQAAKSIAADNNYERIKQGLRENERVKQHVRDTIRENNGDVVGIPAPDFGINPPNEGDLRPIHDDIVVTPELKEQIIAAVKSRRDVGINPPVEEMPIVTPPVEDMPIVEPVQPGELGDGVVQEYAQAAQAAAKQSGQAAAAQTQSQIDELYALGNQNANDIDTLFSEVDRLDTRIDQTQALNAATVNARPMVANGMTAFGAGVGYAGSEAALAIGVAHSFVDTGWSASGTLAASSDDVVVGGGVQYAF